MKENAFEKLTSLLGSGVRIVNSPYDEGSGGDVDCVVDELDQRWPLRLNHGWRLRQCIHYDITGWYWILERDGEVVALDSLEDARGIGKYAFPVGLFKNNDREAVIAAYLTAKRIRKGIRDEEEWGRIARLAKADPPAYAASLEAVFGDRGALRIVQAVSHGRAPSEHLWRRARFSQIAHRVRRPTDVAEIAWRSLARVGERMTRPTGFIVLIVGTDGSGKSTVATELPARCEGLFRRYRHIHWRPGLLPRPGSIVAKEHADPTDPHARPARGRTVSLAFLLYYWVDFLLGDWLRVRPIKARSGLVVWERGWWDFAVDPRRYRLKVPASFVRALGRLLPRPDLAVRLTAPADVLYARKPELDPQEIERQNLLWKERLPTGVPQVQIDSDQSIERVLEMTRNAIGGQLEERAFARLSAGWVSLPRFRDQRWIFPRGPRRLVASALLLYQPVTPTALIGWSAARVMSRAGMFRLLPRSKGPPLEVRDVLSPYVPSRGHIAVMRVRGTGRFLALILDGAGRRIAVAKIAIEERGIAQLDSEARAIETLGSLLPPPATAPEIIEATSGLLLLKAIEWKPRARPWHLPEQLAAALGTFFAKGTSDGRTGPLHGDFAPWNVLYGEGRWSVIDWEHASSSGPPMFDLFHYLVQGSALLGRPKDRRILDGLSGRGWIASSIRAYCEAASLDPSEAPMRLASYLKETRETLDLDASDGRRGYGARTAMLKRLEG